MVRAQALAVAAVRVVTGGLFTTALLIVSHGCLLALPQLPAVRWHGHGDLVHAWLAVTAAAHLSAAVQARFVGGLQRHQ
jgi:hypothetical protein